MPALVVRVIAGTLLTGVNEPEAVTVWAPAGDAGTAKLALQFPLSSAKGDGGFVITVSPSYVIVMSVSPALNPVPVMVAWVPGGALLGLEVIFGVTIKENDAECVPVATML
jgi:hypothetical protein